MAKNGTATYDPRQLWVTNVAPLVTAAREGASHAARTAREERARANRSPAWWQQRWVIVTAAGLVIAGAAGGAYAVVAKRRSAAKPGQDEMTSQPGGTDAETETEAGGLKSTVEAGRDKMADVARSMMHKIRREPDSSTPEHLRNNEMPTTGTGYGSSGYAQPS